MKRFCYYLVILSTIFFATCQKEISFDGGNSISDGSLSDDITGNCLPKTVNGTYTAGTTLAPSINTIQVTVNVAAKGSYVIYSDTVNGYYFRSSGIFSSTGSTLITLKGNGTPLAAGTNNFNIFYDSTSCSISINVLPAGSSGGGPAAFSIVSSGTPANCSGATAAGNYIIGTPLSSSTNKVTLSVNVTTIGTYNISTTAVNGMTFSASGSFTSTGVQNLVLTGSGTPTGTAGTVNISITAGSSTCSFSVTTKTGSAFSFNCSTAVVDGTYETGVSLSSSNTVDIDVNVTTAGPYNISTTATNGMVFTASGTFASTGGTSIQLIGSGTPTAVGTFSIPMPGTTSCTFPITVTAGPTIDWSFKQGTTTYQGSIDNATLTPIASFVNFTYFGSNADETLLLSFTDIAGGIHANETYSTTSTTGNAAAFGYSFSGGDVWSADPQTPGTSLTIKVTSFNTSTKTISGTFSGTVKNSSGTVLTITSGTFAGTYQ